MGASFGSLASSRLIISSYDELSVTRCKKVEAWADLDTIYGVDILHTVKDDPPNLLQRLVWTHNADSVALHEHVATRQKFNCLVAS